MGARGPGRLMLLLRQRGVGVLGSNMFGFGSNANGKLGRAASTIPADVGSVDDWQDAHSGSSFSLAIRDGRLFAAGASASPASGLPEGAPNATRFQQISELTGWTYVHTFLGVSFGIRNGLLYSWGTNQDFVTGRNTNVGESREPVQVGTLSGWTYVVAGGVGILGNAYVAAGIRNGELYTWGSNEDAGTGRGTESGFTQVPTRVGSRSDWTDVDFGVRFLGFAVLGVAGGRLFRWGRSLIFPYPLVGTPSQIGSSTNWSAVALAKGSDVRVAIQGGVLRSITGDTTVTQRSSITGFHSVKAGGTSPAYFLATRTNGELYSWGGNTNGQTGQGVLSGETPDPTRVGTDSDWTKARPGADPTNGSSFAFKPVGS